MELWFYDMDKKNILLSKKNWKLPLPQKGDVVTVHDKHENTAEVIVDHLSFDDRENLQDSVWLFVRVKSINNEPTHKERFGELKIGEHHLQIKRNTDIEQSKRLLELLGDVWKETADFYISSEGVDYPCWSLQALVNAIPRTIYPEDADDDYNFYIKSDEYGMFEAGYHYEYFAEDYYVTEAPEMMDAVFGTVVKFLEDKKKKQTKTDETARDN